VDLQVNTNVSEEHAVSIFTVSALKMETVTAAETLTVTVATTDLLRTMKGSLLTAAETI
jgi:hypothetical protein